LAKSGWNTIVLLSGEGQQKLSEVNNDLKLLFTRISSKVPRSVLEQTSMGINAAAPLMIAQLQSMWLGKEREQA
jgi:hypothetical protein